MKKTFPAKQTSNIDTFAFAQTTAPRLMQEERDKILMCSMEYIPIVDFDLSSLHGMKINNAVLYLKLAGEDYPLEVEVTSISCPWNAEFADWYNSGNNLPWGPGKHFTDVIMNNGYSAYFRDRVFLDEDRMSIGIHIHPCLVYSMVNGQSFGIGIVDCKSKTFDTSEERLLEIKRFHGSGQESFDPILEIDFCEYDFKQPDNVKDVKAIYTPGYESFKDASVSLEWKYSTRPTDEYLFYSIYYVECDDKNNDMKRVEKSRVPGHTPNSEIVCAEICGLKPDTSYKFIVSVSNNRFESEYACCEIRTQGTSVELKHEQCEIATVDINNEYINGCRDFNIFVTDDIVKVNPVDGCVYECDNKAYGGSIPNIREYAGDILNGQGARLTAAAGEKLAFQCILENRTEAPVKIEWAICECELDSNCIDIHKVWYVKCEDGWLPEVAIPMVTGKKEIGIPFAENEIPGQSYQSIFIDVNVPEQCPAGDYHFKVEFRSDGIELLLPVHLKVEDIRLETPDFTFELLGYTPAPSFMGSKYGDYDYISLEEEYYRTAFSHDLSVNILPYMQSGKVHEGFAPACEIIDDNIGITDWSEWDRHFSRYLDGTYLKGYNSRNTPVSHMFLPFNENWPMPVDKYYKIKVSTIRYPEMINESKLKNTTLENDFLPGYRAGIKKIFKDFIKHIDEKGWNHIRFFFYLNNKHYWKNRNLKVGWGKYMGSASSWWLLDEPLIRDDWEALAFYGKILKEAQKEMKSGYNIRFRVDISRYHLMFHSLDDLMDLACISSLSFQKKASLAKERKGRYGEEFWVYGHLNPINKSNMETCINIINIYGAGGQGFLPWNNYGKDEAYEIPTDIAGLYPGNRFGLKGPTVSLRLKAARKGMQMLKYLQTLKNEFKLNDIQIQEYVSGFLNTSCNTQMEFMDDAGVLRYEPTPSSSLEKMKKDIIRRLLYKLP